MGKEGVNGTGRKEENGGGREEKERRWRIEVWKTEEGEDGRMGADVRRNSSSI